LALAVFFVFLLGSQTALFFSKFELGKLSPIYFFIKPEAKLYNGSLAFFRKPRLNLSIII